MSASERRSMLGEERRAILITTLEREGVVRISDMAERMGVTQVTLRRDIGALSDEGVVRRVHGGAVLAERRTDDVTEQVPSTNAAFSSDITLGMLVPSLDYYWPSVIRGAEKAAEARHMRLVLRGSSYEADDMRAQIDRLLDGNAVSGLVLAPNMAAEHTTETLEWLAGTDTPVVLVERRARNGALASALESVTTDHAEGARIALRHLVELGHRRMGMVTSTASPTSQHLRRGWHNALAELSLGSSRDIDVDVPEPSEPGWAEVADAVLSACRETGTTALLVHADAAAAALVQRCVHHGMSVPRDLSVIAYDDEFADIFTPRLTAVRPPRQSIGHGAIDLLAARIADRNRPLHRVVITPSLRVRETTVPPR
ncbi:substrate-binding domain-containing protein [Demequina muriae]|uniref:Substrate-binding domain-containing protein n=1 Tax=Demequina muriae TaxID=3051664 RepID=A0ABT8GEV6_9MICO|nr:substrate-binding domain-containing protein [Demequina sp. EGI L300058]MDN4479874.1 substrate-binding domain-containing protein [Demequina sp. EGI L300058]